LKGIISKRCTAGKTRFGASGAKVSVRDVPKRGPWSKRQSKPDKNRL